MYVECHGHVPGMIWLQVIRGGIIPQLVSTVPLCTGIYVNTAVHVVFRDIYFFSIEAFFFSCSSL